jgi:two-component SAPR family response regulator
MSGTSEPPTSSWNEMYAACADDRSTMRSAICGARWATIEIDGRPVAVASKKARALLGYLALREGAEVSRGVLSGLLWGERSESQARASLRQTLSELRAALGSASPSIMASKETVAWVAGSAWIDGSRVKSRSRCAKRLLN